MKGLLKVNSDDWHKEYLVLYSEVLRRMREIRALYTYYKSRAERLQKELGEKGGGEEA